MIERDRVHLLEDVSVCSKGDEGVVTHVDPQGRMTVAIDHHRPPGCESFSFLLVGVRQDQVALGWKCSAGRIR